MRNMSATLRKPHGPDDEYFLEGTRKNTPMLSKWWKPLIVDMLHMRPELRGREASKVAEVIDESIRWNV